ncbi:hypothetical protein QUA00_16445 [Microcoleus sp. T2B6]|uniref:hypothetical protein n=1 Tax=unclassified Microcoleus TaxID=2642155 RepID=UPI002FD73853
MICVQSENYDRSFDGIHGSLAGICCRSCDRAIESEDVRVGYFWALSRSHPGASTLG